MNLSLFSQRWRMLSPRGHTLVEILVATIVGVFLVSSVYALHVLTEQSYTISTATLDIFGVSNRFQETLERDIRPARRVVPTKVVGGTTYVTGAEQLILELPAITSGGDPISGKYDYIIYYRNPSQPSRLERKVSKDPASSRRDADRTIIDSIQTLVFQSQGTSLALIGNLAQVNSIQLVSRLQKKLWHKRAVQWDVAYEIRMRNL